MGGLLNIGIIYMYISIVQTYRPCARISDTSHGEIYLLALAVTVHVAFCVMFLAYSPILDGFSIKQPNNLEI